MIDHKDFCTVTLNGVCNCHPETADYEHRFGHPPTPEQLKQWNAIRARAGTSRTVDTEPRVTWLGDTKFTHPPTCGVYRSKHLNWAQDCDCWISRMQKVEPQRASVPMVDPDDVPKEFRPQEYTSKAPWWVWTLIGFGAGLPIGAWAGWPSW